MSKWAKVGAIVLFVFAFTFGLLAVMPKAEASEHQINFGLGYGYANTSDLISQRMGYVYGDRWYVMAERFGGPGYSDSWGGFAGRQVIFRQGKRYEPVLRFGVGYFDEPIEKSGRQVVSDEWVFQLAVSIRFRGVIGFSIADHNSTSGRSDRNKGIDRAALDYYLSFP
jgi:hypothetical protein